MQVVLTQPVEIALRTLSPEDRRKVQAWLDHLENWENDRFVREHSHKLDSPDGVYLLRTTSDIRIFFTLEKERIVILDVAKKDTLLTFSQVSTAPEKP